MSEPARILIVDDEPNVRLVFRTALLSNTCSLATVDDGESALRQLSTERFDLVLLDLQMPGLGGLDVLRKLRESGNDVPVIIITAFGRVPDAVEAMKLGAIDFLSKPMTPDALRSIVADVLSRRRETQTPNPQKTQVVIGPSTSALREAKAAINRRDFRVAEEFLRDAVNLEPDSAEAHNLLGVLHELRRDREASRLAYRAALRADRSYEPARRNLWRLYEKTRFGKSEIGVDIGEEPPGDDRAPDPRLGVS